MHYSRAHACWLPFETWHETEHVAFLLFLSPSLISHQTTASKKVIGLIEINKDMGKKMNFY